MKRLIRWMVFHPKTTIAVATLPWVALSILRVALQ